MANIKISLSPGIKANDTSYSSQGSFRSANKVRFREGRAEVAKGYERVSFDLVPGVVRNIMAWKDRINAPLIALGSNSSLYVWRSGAIADITPVDFATGDSDQQSAPGYGRGPYGKGPYGVYAGTGGYAVKTWAFSEIGQGLIASPRRGALYLWENDMNAPAILVSDLPGANKVPELCDYSLFTKNRQLLAFGCNEELSGVFNPLCIRGSDLGAEAPIQEWESKDDNAAFEEILPRGGSIIAARNWGDQIGVWTQSGGVFMGTFVGDPSQIYRFDPVSGTPALAGPNALVIVADTAYWLTPDLQVWSLGRGGAPNRIECPIHNDTLANMATSQLDKVVLSYVPSENELRIDYPDMRDAGLENSRFVSLKLDGGSWSAGIECRTAYDSALSLQYPVSAQSFKRVIPHVGFMTTNAAARKALLAAQIDLPAMSGLNVIDASHGAATGTGEVTENANGESGWGFSILGGNTGSVRLTGFTVPASTPVSISFKAKVTGAETANARIFLTHAPGVVETISQVSIGVTETLQTFRMENVTTPANLTNVGVTIAPVTDLPTGVEIEITDVKVEIGSVATEWTPNPYSDTLLDDYRRFISNLVYSQNVSEFYYEEFGQSADGGSLVWDIETNDFALDDGASTWLVRGFYPDFINQQGFVYVTVYMRMTAQADEEEVYGPFLLLPGEERVDFTGTGKFLRFKFSGEGNPASLRMGTPFFDAVKAGSRGSR